MKLTEEQIQEIMPNCAYAHEWVRPLNQAFEKFEVDTIQRVAAFLGQVAVESAEMNRLEEGLNYRPQRLVAVWPKRFHTLDDAMPYGRNPEKLANKVYANRMGNGAERTGDGFRYRGRGLLQITGRDNYVRIARLMNMPALMDNPDYLMEKRYAALSAATYWKFGYFNEMADDLSDGRLEDRVKGITKKINGGTHGLDDRIKFTERALFTFDDNFNV